MNNTEHIELENREIWLIDQNSIKAYEREQGKLEGKLEANLATAINLLDMGLSMEQVIKATELTAEQIQNELKSIRSIENRKLPM